MPKTAFSTSAFQAATPGLTRLAMAIGGGGSNYEQAKNNEILLQSRIAQQIATQREHNAKADQINAQLESAKPEAVMRNVMTGYGVPLDEAPSVTNYLNSGRLGGKYEPAADDMGPYLPAPDWSKNLGAVGRAIMATRNALTLGDKNSENVASATGKFRDQSLSDAIIAGTADRNTVGGAQAAAAGKPLFNSDSTGSVLDQFTGSLNTDNPMAGATIGLRKEQAGAQKANAAQSYASADNSRASAGKTRVETDLLKTAPKGKFDPATGMIIDERNATARPIIGPDGKQIVGRGKPLTEAQAKDNGYGSRMMESDRIINELQGEYSPLAVNARVSADKSIVPGAGAVANWIQSEKGQQVEQAQRDFINAILRRESGAVIAESEFANARQQYFPQPNDKPETLRQKARNRKIAIEGVLGSVPKEMRGLPSLTNPNPAPAFSGDGGSTGGFTYLGKEE